MLYESGFDIFTVLCIGVLVSLPFFFESKKNFDCSNCDHCISKEANYISVGEAENENV